MSDQETSSNSSNSLIYILTGLNVTLSVIFLVCMEFILDASVYTSNKILCYCLIVSVLPVIYAFIVPKFAKIIAIVCTVLTVVLIVLLFLFRNTVSFYVSESKPKPSQIAKISTSKVNVVFYNGREFEPIKSESVENNEENEEDVKDENNPEEEEGKETKEEEVKNEEAKGEETPNPDENSNQNDEFIENEKNSSNLIDNRNKKSNVVSDDENNNNKSVKNNMKVTIELELANLTNKLTDKEKKAEWTVVEYDSQALNELSTLDELEALYKAFNKIHYSKLGIVNKLIIYFEVPNASDMKEYGFKRKVTDLK